LEELQTLGADTTSNVPMPPMPDGGTGIVAPTVPIYRSYSGGSEFVLTRLHVRYDKSALGDDLFFREASPIVGGREFVVGANGKLEEGAKSSSMNNFQARYVIRHPWTGAIACKHPQRGVWGGPPGGYGPRTAAAPGLGLVKATNAQLNTFITGSLPAETFLSSAAPTPILAIPRTDADQTVVDASAPTIDASPSPPQEQPKGGCAGCAVGGETQAGAFVAALFAFVLGRRRKRSS
jgi:MYXO-CTERM domain-containing protein